MTNISQIYNYYNQQGTLFAMFNKKVNFPTDNIDVYDFVYVDDDTPWTIVSYKIYGTINYWWVLSSLNKDMPFYAKKERYIRFIKLPLLKEMLSRIKV